MLENETETAPAAEREVTPQGQVPEGSSQEPQEGAERPEGDEAPPSEAEAASEASAEEAPKPERAKTPEWLQKRFDEMTRQRHEEARRAEAAERRAAELEARWERLQRGEAEPEGEQRRPEPTAERDIEAAAAALMARRTFDQNCNAVVDQGAKEYGADFNEALSTFRMFGGLDPNLAQAAIDAGNAHKTLFHLGTNPEEYERIVTLPPRQQAIALARLSDKLSAPPPPKAISKAPPPIAPVGSNGGRNEITDPDKLSTAEWMRRREAGEIR